MRALAGPGSRPSQMIPSRTVLKPSCVRVRASAAVKRRPGSSASGESTYASRGPWAGPTHGVPASGMSTEPPPHLATRLTPWSCSARPCASVRYGPPGALTVPPAQPSAWATPEAAPTSAAAAISATARLMGRRRTAARLYPSRQTGRRVCSAPAGPAATRLQRPGRWNRVGAATGPGCGPGERDKRVPRTQVSHENHVGMENAPNVAGRRRFAAFPRSPPGPHPTRSQAMPFDPLTHRASAGPSTAEPATAAGPAPTHRRPTSCPCSHRSSARTADPQPWWRTSTRAPPGSTHLSPHCMRATMAGSRSEPFSVSR